MFLRSCAASLVGGSSRRASLRLEGTLWKHYFSTKESNSEEVVTKLSSEAIYSSIPFSERVIRVKRRLEDGKYAARRHRRNGEIPGVLFGGSRLPKKLRKSESEGNHNDHVLVYAVDTLAIEKELRRFAHSFFCLPYQLYFEDEDEYVPAFVTE